VSAFDLAAATAILRRELVLRHGESLAFGKILAPVDTAA
jgi:hypothetical protein